MPTTDLPRPAVYTFTRRHGGTIQAVGMSRPATNHHRCDRCATLILTGHECVTVNSFYHSHLCADCARARIAGGAS